MERSTALTVLACAGLALVPFAADGAAAAPRPVLLAAAESEETLADEADLKKEEEKRKEEEKQKKEAARKAEEEKKKAEREAEKQLKKARQQEQKEEEQQAEQEQEEEPASAAAKSEEAPVQPLQKTFTISPKSAQPPAAAPMKLAPGAVAPNSVRGTIAPGALSPPVSRGGAPVYTAPLAPRSNFSKGELDRPAVPGFGLAPTGGPASGLSGPGMSGAPQEAVAPRPEGPKLPAGTLQLLVNGAFGVTNVFPNQPVNVSWDISPAANTEGIALFVTDNPSATCKSRADANDLFPPSSYHPGFPKGSAAVDLGGQPLGSDLFFIGCAADPDDSGKVKYRKQDTNVVQARYAGAPDLVVSALEMVSGEIRFKVKNIGEAEKPPGEVDYVVGLTFASPSRGTYTRGFGGTAGITSLSRLGPGQETGEDRVTEQPDMKFAGVKQFQLCINPGNKIAESDRTNNCVTRSSGDVLPDLKIVGGRIELGKPKKDKGFWDWTKDIGRCAGPQYLVSQAFGHCNHEFNPSYQQDQVVVTLRNEGGVPVKGAAVRFDLQYDGKAIEGGGMKTVASLLEPGEEVELRKDIGPASKWKYENEACCSAIATADPNGKLLESDESNNKFNITQVER